MGRELMLCDCSTPTPRLDTRSDSLDCVECGGAIPRKPGRPPIPAADRRTKQQIFSPNEWAQVKALAAAEGMTAAAYVRASVQRIAQGS